MQVFMLSLYTSPVPTVLTTIEKSVKFNEKENLTTSVVFKSS